MHTRFAIVILSLVFAIFAAPLPTAETGLEATSSLASLRRHLEPLIEVRARLRGGSNRREASPEAARLRGGSNRREAEAARLRGGSNRREASPEAARMRGGSNRREASPEAARMRGGSNRREDELETARMRGGNDRREAEVASSESAFEGNMRLRGTS
ncbi:hypothetical protein PtrSN002B_004543 [Pyrenophora tritici-repentis]|nr:hypothetical protein PtrSN002B_004543 [Pyrenophora tritici-repentis]